MSILKKPFSNIYLPSLLIADVPLQVIVTPIEATEKDQLAETLTDYCPSLEPPYVMKIPWNAPLTRQQYEESIQYWPVNFHEDKK